MADRRATGLGSQAAQLSAARVAAAAVSAVWLVLAARHLSLRAYGDLVQLVSLSVVLTAVADAGLSILLAHDTAADPASSRSVLRTVLRTRLLLGLPACVAVAVLYRFAAGDTNLAAVGLISVSMLTTMVHQCCCITWRGIGDVRPEVINEFVSRLFVLGLGFAVLEGGGGLLAAVAVYATADLLSALVLATHSRRHLPGAATALPTAPVARSRVAPLAGIVIAMTVYARADLWLMGVLEGSVSVARYAAPYRLFEGTLLVAGAFAALIPPAIARHRGTERGRDAKKLVTEALALTAVAVVVGFLAAEPLLRALYGDRYANAASTLRILLVAAIPSAAVLVLVQATALLRRRATLVAVLVALVANAGANLVLIPPYGPDGAAVVTLVTQTLLAAWLAVLLREARGDSTPVDDPEVSEELVRAALDER